MFLKDIYAETPTPQWITVFYQIEIATLDKTTLLKCKRGSTRGPTKGALHDHRSRKVSLEGTDLNYCGFLNQWSSCLHSLPMSVCFPREAKQRSQDWPCIHPIPACEVLFICFLYLF